MQFILFTHYNSKNRVNLKTTKTITSCAVSDKDAVKLLRKANINNITSRVSGKNPSIHLLDIAGVVEPEVLTDLLGDSLMHYLGCYCTSKKGREVE